MIAQARSFARAVGGVLETAVITREHRMFRSVSGIALAALALFATAASAQQAVVVQGAMCRGEEPFWQLEASRTTVVFNRLATKGNREVIFRGTPQAFMFLTPAAVVWRGDSTHLPRETLVVALREEACRSTMADGPPLPWRAMVSLKPGEALTGCCTVLAGYDVKAAPVADFPKKIAGRLGAFAARPVAGHQPVPEQRRGAREVDRQGRAGGQRHDRGAHDPDRRARPSIAKRTRPARVPRRSWR
jgi:uncharacterized membrane protein